ncbi:hypothetical protein ECANGB1_1033 [Enterospora canceri]|uniref:Uncharacterized protein n=1 Tax=Enterospora canceri TaxID=1081671 RepID=A0A1Y1S7Q7_9MICR|nr:hypothetical protein ECANGB1_1033 [Enterospora canceri]
MLLFLQALCVPDIENKMAPDTNKCHNTKTGGSYQSSEVASNDSSQQLNEISQGISKLVNHLTVRKKEEESSPMGDVMSKELLQFMANANAKCNMCHLCSENSNCCTKTVVSIINELSLPGITAQGYYEKIKANPLIHNIIKDTVLRVVRMDGCESKDGCLLCNMVKAEGGEMGKKLHVLCAMFSTDMGWFNFLGNQGNKSQQMAPMPMFGGNSSGKMDMNQLMMMQMMRGNKNVNLNQVMMMRMMQNGGLFGRAND